MVGPRVQEGQEVEPSLYAPVAKQRAKAFDMADELARIRGSIDLDEYENKPVPRPPDE